MLIGLLVCSAFISISLIILQWLHEQNEIRKAINKIPGPPTVPIIGNLKDILRPSVELFLCLRKFAQDYYPVFRIWSGHVPAVMVLNPEDVELLISGTKNMEKSLPYECLQGWLGTGLLTSKGNKWQYRRKLLTPAFHFNILRSFMLVFSEQSDVLVNELKGECSKEYTDVVPFITKFTLHSICETAMGTQLEKLLEKQEEYRKAIYKMGDVIVYRIIRPWLYYEPIFCLTKTFWQQRKVFKVLHDFSMNVIKSRTKNFDSNHTVNNGGKKRLAMLDLLISARRSGSNIDEEGIREEVDTFMFEGHDTTTMSICFTLMLLACYPDVQDKVVTELKEVLQDDNNHPTYQQLQDLKYLEMVLKESLRLYPSVPIISRITSEEVHLHSGYIIPARTYIMLPIYDIHRNEKIYPDPEKFDPNRFLPENCQARHPFAFIPFSAGPRNCIGQKFAYLELKTVISKILLNYSVEPYDKPEQLKLIADIILRNNEGIRIKIKPRL